MSNSSTSSSAAYAAYLNKVGNDIQFYFNLVQWSVGIPCNIFSIIIFARLLKNKTNMGFLYIWQCAIDLSLLLFFLFLFRSGTTMGFNLYLQSDSMCKFLQLLRRFILHASSWAPVLTTFDRFTFVLYGHADRFRFLKSKLHLTLIILAGFAVLTIVNIPNLNFYLNAKGTSCTADFTATISSDIISILMRTYIPFLLMIVFNILMIRKIFKNNRTMAKQTNLAQKETHFTFAVIAYDIYFLVFNFPLSVFYIMYDINLYNGAIAGDAVFSASYNVFSFTAANFAFCVQTFSFFLYVAFNKLFLNEIFILLGKLPFINSLSRVQPSNTRQPSNTHQHSKTHPHSKTHQHSNNRSNTLPTLPEVN